MLLVLYNQNIYKSPWLTHVKNILDNCGLSYVWYNQEYLDVNNINVVKKSVQISIADQCIQKWRSDVMLSEKCSAYNYFKNEFVCEKYLTVLPNKFRYVLTKL